MCIHNLSHLNSAGIDSRNFCVSALSSVYIRKSQESSEFISGVLGFCYLITISARAEKNNSILRRLKTRLHLQGDSSSNRTRGFGFCLLVKNSWVFLLLLLESTGS